MTSSKFNIVTDQTCYVFDDNHFCIGFGHSSDNTKPLIKIYTQESEIVHDVFSEMAMKHWSMKSCNTLLQHYTEKKFKSINQAKSFKANGIKTNEVIFVHFN